MKKNFYIFIVAVVVLVAIILTARKQQERVVPPIVYNTPEQPVEVEDTSDCGFTLTSPLAGASVSFPLSVTAIVDNTDAVELGCSWTMFEAQAAFMELKDEDGAVLATGVLDTGEEWMTTGPVNFSGTLSPANPVPAGTLLTLVINEEDPSDGEAGAPSVVSVPLIAQ